MDTNTLYDFLKTGKTNSKPNMKIRTVRDEMVTYLYNEKQIPSTGYVKHLNFNKIKEMYLKYVNSQKGTEND